MNGHVKAEEHPAEASPTPPPSSSLMSTNMDQSTTPTSSSSPRGGNDHNDTNDSERTHTPSLQDQLRGLAQRDPTAEPAATTELGVAPIPHYRYDAERFTDPYFIIEELSTTGERIGAVKITPPPEWKHQPKFKDLTKLKFKTVSQTLARNGDEKLKFYKDLVRFHKSKNTPLVRFPSVDKRIVDLYKLHKSVAAKGGFNNVCAKKQWAQVGRELGYIGKTMTSLSTSLKVTYLKFVHAYDRYLADPNGTETAEDTNGENKRPMEESAPESTDEPASKRQKRETPGFACVTNSRSVLRRSKDLLRYKGFETNIEPLAPQTEPLPEPESKLTLQNDNNFWHNGIDVLDDAFHYSEYGRTKDLNSLFDAYGRNSHLEHTSEEAAMKEFWDKLNSQDQDFRAEGAYDLPTSIYGSGFATTSDPVKEEIADPWNLHNLPLHEKGVLRYLASDQELLSKPRLNIATTYSVQSYHLQDHMFYGLDYLHMGAPKVWYFIPVEERERYEELLTRVLSENNTTLGSEELDSTESFEEHDEIRGSTTNPVFFKFYEFSPKVSKFHTDFLLSPDFLKENGIHPHQVIQRPGDFVVTWPGCYAATVSLGVSLSECVSFAPLSWTKHGLEAEKWLCKQGIMPSFSYNQLLCSIVEECKDSEVLKLFQEEFDEFAQNEIQFRADLKAKIGGQVRFISNKFDYIADDSLRSCFPTKVVIRSGQHDFFNLDPQRVMSGEIRPEDFKDCKPDIHVFYTDEKLRSMQRSLATLSQSPADWLEKLEALLLKEAKPPIRLLRNLYAESERITFEIPEARALGVYLKHANDWVERAQEALNAKQKNRIRNRRQAKSDADEEEKQLYDFEQLESLINEVPKLSFSTPEIEQIVELAEEIHSFEISARSFLLDDDHTEDEFVEMIDLGKSFGVRLRSIDLLERIVGRWRWIKDLEEVTSKPCHLEELIDLWERAGDLCSTADAERMAGLEKRIYEGKMWSARVSQKLTSVDFPLFSLRELLEKTQQIALFEDVETRLKQAKEKLQESQGVLAEVVKQMDDTSDELNELRKLLTLRGTPNFDQARYEKLMGMFTGEVHDRRPRYAKAKAVMDKPEFSGIRSPHVNTMYMDYEAVETWQRRAKKIIGKVNAPLHLLQSHLETLNEKTAYAFAVSDKFEASRKDDEHVLFCLCRRGESGTMICCEKCMEWYHCKCLKFGRNRSKEVENYMCPICDYRIEIPKEYNTPNLEEVQQLLEDGATLKLVPDTLHLVHDLFKEADAFRHYLKEVLPWENGRIVSTNIAELKFYLRKLEGAAVLLADEYNQLRQLIWRLDPYCDKPPPVIAAGNKTKKRRATRLFAPPPIRIAPPTSANPATVQSSPIGKLLKIPIIQPVGNEGDRPSAQFALTSSAPRPDTNGSVKVETSPVVAPVVQAPAAMPAPLPQTFAVEDVKNTPAGAADDSGDSKTDSNATATEDATPVKSEESDA